jgi:phosphate transport system substrate-binding protein
MAKWGVRFGLWGVAVVIALFSLVFSAGSGFCAEAPEALSGLVVIEGTGDCQTLVRALASAFERENPGVRIEVPDTTGSKGGLRALANGKCDLARIARPLSDEDKAQGITDEPFALTPLVFIINAGVTGIADVSAAQVADIYAGRIVSCNQLGGGDLKIYPLTREAGDILHTTLKTAVPSLGDLDPAKVKVYYSSQKLIDDVAAHPGAVGFTPLTETHGRGDVRAIRFEGVSPTTGNVASGAYCLRLVCALAWRPATLTRQAKAFVAFMHTERAKNIIADMGGAPCGETSPDGR